ncbi:GAF domain-containing protein [Secundilactobacillus folii]|uniref:GAF domain-containing protein n=1 Tax=Secundilactobacillus folii TaxID=2678357 RepID=A0A7X2XV88_9LACO|nr:GAF domain-containing protein [Secundilactobacillus folii]MTV82160.1 GAF domain-containing protein [Secundilactobacillus folii]
MSLEELDSQHDYQRLVNRIYHAEDFDFVGLALPASGQSTIKWYFVAGNQNEQFRKIVLRSGIGIAGLVVKTGKPFWKNGLHDVMYESKMYTPIAKTESLQSAAAIPIYTSKVKLADGVLLAGYRSDQQVSAETISRLSRYLTTD